MLRTFGLAPVQWKTEAFWNFVAMCITNIWLGIPFMMIVILGGLQSIAGDYYEAAEIDGAGALSSWRGLLPLYIFVILGPAFAGGWLASSGFAREGRL